MITTEATAKPTHWANTINFSGINLVFVGLPLVNTRTAFGIKLNQVIAWYKTPTKEMMFNKITIGLLKIATVAILGFKPKIGAKIMIKNSNAIQAPKNAS